MKNLFLNILLFLSLLLVSCSEEVIHPSLEEEETSGLPVELTALIGDESLTRDLNENSKKSFATGEVIHVEAKFYDKGNTQLGGSQYKTFERKSDGSWKQVVSSTMRWPAKAVKGKFKAYFVNSFQETLEIADQHRQLKLGDLDEVSDPLMAEQEGEWGQKINLKFKHICTHLTFKSLEPGVTDYFWLINKNSGDNFHNGFRLWLTGNNELRGDFISIPDMTYKKLNITGKESSIAGDLGDLNGDNESSSGESDGKEDEENSKFGLVYVQRPTVVYNDEKGPAGKVEFFLEPGDYSNVELRTINNYSYLSYKSELTSNLLANTPYEVDIVKNKGVTFIDDDDNWDDDDDNDVYLVDPEEFLGCIEAGTDDYTIEVEKDGRMVERTILKNTSSGTILRYNVRFDYNSDYTQKLTFDMSQGKYFDGGNHFISEIAANLFESNHGTISHLWLKDVKCDVELYEHDSNDSRNSQWGLLCRTNVGVIENVRIDDFDIDFSIGAGRDNYEFTFDLGGLTGNNSGTISDISFGGEINLTSSEQDNMRCTLNLGGLVGQNTGVFNGVKPMGSDAEIKVKHSLQGEQAAIYCGGAIGYSSTDVRNVSLPRVTVDASGGQGLVSQVGGLVGRLRGTVGTPSYMTSCTVSGNIKGMEVKSFGGFTGFSYTGGLTGYSYYFDVTDCRSLCNVEVPDGDTEDSVIYATGGGFGRLLTPENNITNNYIWGSILTGPSNYIGNFCGIVPSSKKWDDYKADGNNVKEIISGKFVGASLDDNS